MKKLTAITLILAVFIIILVFVIAPRQGALEPSTMIIPTNSTIYEEIPIQEIAPGKYARSIIIAVLMLSHVLFANLHLGGSWVAATTESLNLKTKKERFKRLAKSITLFNVILFSFGATFAVAVVLAFIGLYPEFAKVIFHIFWWPFLVEAITFALEIIFLYVYWFTWDKIKAGWHQFLGYGYAVVVFCQTVLINMVANGMLISGDSITWGDDGYVTMPPDILKSWFFNGVTWRLQFHRLFAAISYIGFVLAMLSMFHYWDRKDDASKKYWDWVGSYGIAWGLLGLIFQPIFGLIYMLGISDKQDQAFQMIMHGPRAWEMLLMVSLLSALFLAIISFFIDKRNEIISQRETKTISSLFKAFLIVGSLAALILIQPAWWGKATFIDDPNAIANPLGIMDLKYVALFTLVLIGAFMLMIDTIVLGDTRTTRWGKLSRQSRFAAILSGILGMGIVVVMGYVRESARSPYLIYNFMPIPDGDNNYTPISIYKIFAVWISVVLITIVVFWFTSKATAHHPERAEEIPDGDITVEEKSTDADLYVTTKEEDIDIDKAESNDSIIEIDTRKTKSKGKST